MTLASTPQHLPSLALPTSSLLPGQQSSAPCNLNPTFGPDTPKTNYEPRSMGLGFSCIGGATRVRIFATLLLTGCRCCRQRGRGRHLVRLVSGGGQSCYGA
jgi:hypothetical protein